MRRLSTCAAALSLVLLGGSARAQAEATVVVDVSPGATRLGAEELRRRISEELHAPALAPDDADAARARGTIKVDVDAAKDELVVSYATRAAPISRRVRLPPDAEAARREATVLAGNLARDESGEIAAELRKGRPAEAPAPSELPPDRAELERMHAVVAYYAAAERREAVTGDVLLIAGGVALGTLGGYQVARGGDHGSDGLTFIVVGTTYTGLGTSDLVRPTSGRFERLARRERDESAEKFGDAWAMLAKEERSGRTAGAWLRLTAGALCATLGVAVVSLDGFDVQTRVVGGVALFSAAAYGIYSGVNAMVTPGPVEEALRAYEKTSGRSIWAIAPPRFRVGFVRGGATVGVGGAF
jgi:hypothetical protein